VLNELSVQISLKKTLPIINHQGKTINTNIAEVQAKDVAFLIIDDIHATATSFYRAARSCSGITAADNMIWIVFNSHII
jgi:hypothetical protein